MIFPCPFCPKEYHFKSSRTRHIWKEHRGLLSKQILDGNATIYSFNSLREIKIICKDLETFKEILALLEAIEDYGYCPDCEERIPDEPLRDESRD